MKKSSLVYILFIISTVVFAQQRPASKPIQTQKPVEQQKPSAGKWFGVLFSDLSYVIQEPQTLTPGKGTTGKNSFDVTRVQLGYEHTFNKDFSARVVFDPRGGVGLQEANIVWSNIFPMQSFTMGMIQTSAEETAEKVFGYRSLGAMIFNRKEYSPEYDFGAVFAGKFDPQGMVYYSLGVANGSGIMPDTNKIKKYSVNFGIAPDRASMVEVYADYENFLNGRSVINTKLMYGMFTRAFAFGVEGFYRMERKFAGTPTSPKDITPAGGSLFGWFEMTKGVRGVIRVDGLDQDLNNDGPATKTVTTADDIYREVYVNAGIDYTPIPEVHLIPNVIYEKRLEKGSSAVIADVIVARLTAAVYF